MWAKPPYHAGPCARTVAINKLKRATGKGKAGLLETSSVFVGAEALVGTLVGGDTLVGG
eukprot:CAMPEP_0175151300 /NCGR_PEP_ID=MMETSP0087-20121206/18415_1 /TAXON_ID=136419 /ORGANISM="Unknown Unknown, Strain D1" /LENGTH=58 /DNA_ID=CAMNT_0016437473 /DNA_START=168 /DNA_END=340 /DNA_ORIENTATION=-